MLLLTFLFLTKFIVFLGAFCGNKIVEAGEECDCGYDDDECVDKCCYPRQVSELDKIKNNTAKGCSRKYETQCRYAMCASKRRPDITLSLRYISLMNVIMHLQS